MESKDLRWSAYTINIYFMLYTNTRVTWTCCVNTACGGILLVSCFRENGISDIFLFLSGESANQHWDFCINFWPVFLTAERNFFFQNQQMLNFGCHLGNCLAWVKLIQDLREPGTPAFYDLFCNISHIHSWVSLRHDRF